MNQVSKIIIIIIKRKKRKKSIKVKWEETEGEKEGVGYFNFFYLFSSLLSQIYENRIIGFHRD